MTRLEAIDSKIDFLITTMHMYSGDNSEMVKELEEWKLLRSQAVRKEYLEGLLNITKLESMENELEFLIDRVPYSNGQSKIDGYKKIESLKAEIKAEKRKETLDKLL